MKALSRPRSLLPPALRFYGLLVSISVMNATPAPQTESIDRDTDVDVAKAQAGARIVKVSSGPSPARFRAIDDDLRTRFSFADSDNHPVIVLELPKTEPIHGVGVVPGSQG